jgi:hypothetical protein
MAGLKSRTWSPTVVDADAAMLLSFPHSGRGFAPPGQEEGRICAFATRAVKKTGRVGGVALYAIIHSLPRPAMFAQGTGLVLSLVIAELFYKFHSFTLEALAFLATWYVLGGIAEALARMLKR